MKNFAKIRMLLLPLLFFNTTILFARPFQKSILVDIPGSNYDFDLFEAQTYPGYEAYITWINLNDSVYTVYLKKISPILGDDIIIASHSLIKFNPKVASNSYSYGIKIVWQNYSNGNYSIKSRNYLNDTLSNMIVIKDSLTADPQVSLSASL